MNMGEEGDGSAIIKLAISASDSPDLGGTFLFCPLLLPPIADSHSMDQPAVDPHPPLQRQQFVSSSIQISYCVMPRGSSYKGKTSRQKRVV